MENDVKTNRTKEKRYSSRAIIELLACISAS